MVQLSSCRAGVSFFVAEGVGFEKLREMDMKMNSVEEASLICNSTADRRDYSPPKLTHFGKVSDLTQAQSGCNKADNPGCTTGGINDMGSKMS